MAHPTISVVVNTLNEQRDLPYALRSVASWVDEIIVVDMQSTDDTVRIAESFGARVFSVEPVGYADPARAFAVAQASSDWVLVLDADELIPEPLSRRLIELASEGRADVVMCPFRTFLLGEALRGSGWGISDQMHPRFFRNGSLVFRPEVHSLPDPAVGARVTTLDARANPEMAVQHFNYLGFGDFLDRLNRYTSIEAVQAAGRGESSSAVRGLGRAGLEVVWRLLRKKGYRDGWRGFYLSFLMGTYRLVIRAKQKQLETVGTDDQIAAIYHQEAERILASYSARKPLVIKPAGGTGGSHIDRP